MPRKTSQKVGSKNQDISGNTLRSNKSVYRNRQSISNRPVRRCRPPRTFDPSPAVGIPAEDPQDLADTEVEAPVQVQPAILARIIVPQAGTERETRRRGIQLIPSAHFMNLLNRPTTRFSVEQQEEELSRLPKGSPPPTNPAAVKRTAPVEDSLRYLGTPGSSNALNQIRPQMEVDQPIGGTEDLFRRPLPPPVAVPEETPSPPAQPILTPRSGNTPSNRSISTPTTTCPTPRQSQSPHFPDFMRLDSPAIRAMLAPGTSRQSAHTKQNEKSHSSLQESRPVAYNYPPYFGEAGPSRVRSSSYPVDVEEIVDEINSKNSSQSSTGLPAELSRRSTPPRTEVIPEEVLFKIVPFHRTSSIVQNPPEAAAATNPLPKSFDPSPQPTTSTSNEVPPPAPGQAVSRREIQQMPNKSLKREPGVTDRFKEEIISAEAINRAMYLRYALEASTHEHQLCVDLIKNVGDYHRMRAEYKKLVKSLDSLENEILNEEYKAAQKKRLAAQEELGKITAQRNQISSEYEFDFWITGVSSNREKEDTILVELAEIDLVITRFEGAAKEQKDAEINEKKRALIALEKVIIDQETNVLRFKKLHD